MGYWGYFTPISGATGNDLKLAFGQTLHEIVCQISVTPGILTVFREQTRQTMGIGRNEETLHTAYRRNLLPKKWVIDIRKHNNISSSAIVDCSYAAL